MNHSRGNVVTTAIPILVLVSVAAVGWYSYYSEVNINESLSVDSHAVREQLQATIHKLQEDEAVLKTRLVSEEKRQQELTAVIEKITAEKKEVESTWQQADKKAKLAAEEVEAGLEKLQSRINKLLENERMLQASLASEKKSQNELSALLEKTEADKIEMNTALQQEVKKARLTATELETEIEKHQAVQRSLNSEFITISGERTQLIARLEQEQKNKKQIANLKSRLEEELNESRVEVSQLKNQMTVIKLTSEVLFSSGSAQIKPAGQKVLSIIADSLNAYPDRIISVEGHTDNLPITQNEHYESNWELSTARGLAAVYYFQQNNHVDPKRLKVVGYGQYRPVSSNETAEGRMRNRRIEIIMLPPESADATRN